MRCDEGFENVAALRLHWKENHMRATRVVEEEDSDGDASDASSSDSDSDDENEGSIATADRIFRQGPKTMVEVRGGSDGGGEVHAWVYTALLRTSGNAALASACDDITTPDCPLACIAHDLWREGDTLAVIMMRSGFFSIAGFEMKAIAGAGGSSKGRMPSAAVESRLNLTPVLLHHRRFSHYTTRRKQGGSQSAFDNKGKAAQSVGAQLRRAGEAHLQADIESVMREDKELWVPFLSRARRVFFSIPKRSLPQVFPALSAPSAPTTASTTAAAGSAASNQPLFRNDFKLHRVPFMTARPSVSECTRIAETVCALRFADPAEVKATAAMAAAASSLKKEKKVEDVDATPSTSPAHSLAASVQEPKSMLSIAPNLGRTIGFASVTAAEGNNDDYDASSSSEEDEVRQQRGESTTTSASTTTKAKKPMKASKKTAPVPSSSAASSSASSSAAAPSSASNPAASASASDSDSDLAVLQAAALEKSAEKQRVTTLAHEAQAVQLQAKETEDLAAMVAARLKIPFAALARGLGLHHAAAALSTAADLASVFMASSGGGAGKGKGKGKAATAAGAGKAAKGITVENTIASELDLAKRVVSSAAEKLGLMRSLMPTGHYSTSELLAVSGLDELSAAALVAFEGSSVDWSSIAGPPASAFATSASTASSSSSSSFDSAGILAAVLPTSGGAGGKKKKSGGGKGKKGGKKKGSGSGGSNRLPAVVDDDEEEGDDEDEGGAEVSTSATAAAPSLLVSIVTDSSAAGPPLPATTSTSASSSPGVAARELMRRAALARLANSGGTSTSSSAATATATAPTAGAGTATETDKRL